MNRDKEMNQPEQVKKSPFKDDAALQPASLENGEDAMSAEEESQAEQERKEALTERD
ncbi:MAG TPA: hypothetical protein VM843_03710 [Flavisolibacter sp.]|jgi:hypothetical protein|nr:hypothetical protein [Flavisolibacter sp.]